MDLADIRPTGHARHDSTLSLHADDLFSSLAGMDDFAGDDDLSFDDLDEGRDGLGDLDGSGATKKGKRPASTAEKKATHNAVERARRESLNTRFLVLADLLPGMNHVKRASKAAIVNKSIELIKELQATEARLAKEVEQQKQELAGLRARWGMQPMFMPPAMPASNAAPTTAALQSPIPPTPSSSQVQLPKAESPSSQPNSLMQQQHIASTPAVPNISGYGGSLFAHNVPALMGFDPSAIAAHRTGSASPASHSASQLGAPPSTAGSVAPSALGASAYNGAGYFDAAAVVAAAAAASGMPGGSPLSYAASLQQSPATNSTGLPTIAASYSTSAPSPASSNSVPTPNTNNAYSPSGAALPFIGSAAAVAAASADQRANSPTASHVNPAIAAFDGNNDPAYLAAQFAPRDLAKAQQELQSFIAYQQRLASNSAMQSAAPFMTASATPGSAGFGGMFGWSQPTGLAGVVGANATPTSPFCATPSVANVPAWQMMMAHQAALTAYGGATQF